MAVRRAQYVVVLALSFARPGQAAECETRTMRVTFYTCAEGFSHCLTHEGHQPIPFRTVAVGDRGLLGRWLYIEDLGGWVLAADTGSKLRKNSIDVFIGEGRMARHAKRMGVQYWVVRVCAPGPAEEEKPHAVRAAHEPADPPTRTVSASPRSR